MLSPAPTPTRQRDRCLRCNRSRETCFCGFVKPFDTATRFVLLMHPKEFKRQTTGTGRLAGLALRNSETIVGLEFSGNPRLTRILADETYHPVVLFPGRGSLNLSEGGDLTVPPKKTLLVIIVDATWRLARKIMHVNPALQRLPRICFTPAAPSRFSIKRQPAAHCVSTTEAAYYLLSALEKAGRERLEGRHATLLEAVDGIVRFQSARTGPEPRHRRCTGPEPGADRRRAPSSPLAAEGAVAYLGNI